MFAFAAVLLMVQGEDKVELPVNFVRPSRIVQMLTALSGGATSPSASLLPKGATLSFDDERSVIIVQGLNADGVDSVRRTVGMFDVSPRKILTKVEIQSPWDKFASQSQLELTNNLPTKLSQPTLGWDVAIAGRCNPDGTVTVYLEVDQTSPASRLKDGSRVTITFRAKNGVATEVHLDAYGHLTAGPKKPADGPSRGSTGTTLDLKITPSIAMDPQPRAHDGKP